MAYSSNLYMVTSKEGYEAIYHLVRDLNQLTKLMKYKGNEFVFMEVPHVAEELIEEIIEIMNENTDSIPCNIRMTTDSQFGFHSDERYDFDNKIEDIILPKLIEYESKEEWDYDNEGFDEEYYDDNSRIAFRVPKNCKVVYENFNEMV
ncbi:hypothetical protein SDC9_59717 [bioreactor metagenome]|uniref:Uncharacterized protein n=1 Tax=bioreactor metagenome TaxID=1076179 RepID=A0A644XAX7_9ZZZZ